MHQDDLGKVALAVVVVFLLLWLTVIVTGVWVAAHFIMKYW